ncbi:MAG: CehA/McbA family metallohydrolase [Sandaracinaceae bacterium]
MTRSIVPLAVLFLLLGACDPEPDSDAGPPDGGAASCEAPAFEVGDDGHAEPLAVGAGEARAGRVSAEDLPDFPSRLQMWEGGDFVLANEHIAMVIEDVGESQLYDPWGGRPVGIARMEGGALVDPGDFGEILFLTGRMTPLTQRVSVIADGSDGGAAVVRAEGPLRALPFFETITGALFQEDFTGVTAAIDYVLEPGAEYVDVFIEYHNPDDERLRELSTLHAFMHTPRMPPFLPGDGFDVGAATPWLGFSAERGTSFLYVVPGEDLSGNLEVSGFVSYFSRAFGLSCGSTRRQHARIVVGGPGVDGVTRAYHRSEGTAVEELTGTVQDEAGDAQAGAWVIAQDADGLVTRAPTAADGSFSLGIPEGTDAQLFVHRPGARPVGPLAPAASLTVPTLGRVRVQVTDDDDTALPVRVQLIASAHEEFEPDVRWGLPLEVRNRVRVVYPTDGIAELPAEPGEWRLVVSRGFEYTLVDRTVMVSAGETLEESVMLTRVIDTAGVMCGDFHIHTHRSNDSGDDALLKVRSAIADGLEIPVRSDHEYVIGFQPLVEELGLSDWAFGVASIEMTSFQAWGHMGVVSLEPDLTAINGGAPRWQTYATLDEPDRGIELLRPPAVFATVRERPEQPVVIINHPRGSTNYFGYAGYDPVTGDVARPDDWDEAFSLVEVFNDSDWQRNLDGTVRDWLSLLDHGRRVFAVGSSDSHRLSSSPVGYPRTCLDVGTDDPRMLTPTMIRDRLAAGASTISGGVYVDATVGEAGPGEEASGLGETAMVSVRVQAASWVDVDRIDVVVDGEVTETIDILAEDADPLVPTTRFTEDISVPVAAAGSYVILAAYGDRALEPVHRGRIPFGVTNPIFLAR